MPERYIRPDQVSASNAARVLDFLNAATSAREIADGVEIPGELDIGLRLAQRILDRRAQLGGFTTLDQVADVPLIGPERFTEIVVALTGMRTPRDASEADLDALRAEVRALRQALADLGGTAPARLTLRRVNARPYLGQAVTLMVEATHPVTGAPLTDVPVKLVTTWGEFHSDLGRSVDRERAVVVRTGVDGRVRVRMHPQTREPLLREHRSALEDALRGLDPDAAAPSDVLEGLHELARRYRAPQGGRLREAVDVLAEDPTGATLDPVVHRDVLDFWPTVDTTVTALALEGEEGEGLSSVVTAVATLTLYFRNWLPAWMHEFQATARSENTLGAELGSLVADGQAGGGWLVGAALGRVRGWLDGQRGRVAQRLARTMAEETIRGFLETEVAQLPVAARVSLRQGLSAVSSTVVSQGTAGIVAIERGQELVAARLQPVADRIRDDLVGAVGGLDEIRADLDGLRSDLTTVQSDLTSVQGDLTLVTRDLGNLEQNPALLDLRAAVDGLSEDVVRLDTRVGTLGGRVTAIDTLVAEFQPRLDALEPRVAELDTRIDRVDGRVTDVDRRLAGVDGRVGELDVRIGDVDGRVTTFDERILGVDGRVAEVDERVGALDRQIGRVDGRVGDLDQRVAAVDGRTSELDGRVADVNERVGALDRQVGRVDTRVGDLDQRVSSFDSRVGSLDQRVGSLGSRVGELDARLVTLDTRVEGVDTRIESVRTNLETVDVRVRNLRRGDLR